MGELRTTQIHTLRIFASEPATLSARDLASALGITEHSARKRCWRLVGSGHLHWIAGTRDPRFALTRNGRLAAATRSPSKSKASGTSKKRGEG